MTARRHRPDQPPADGAQHGGGYGLPDGFALRRVGSGYAVFDAAGRRLGAVWTKRDLALEAFHRRLLRARRRVRACLCCGRSFWSAGPGNRLCPVCRREASGGLGLEWVGVAL